MKTQVFIHDTDSCFFEENDYFFDSDSAIEEAKAAYREKYPSESDEDIKAIEWDVVEIEND